MKAFSQFVGFGAQIATYFRCYGGWSAILLSPLFFLSLVIVGLSYPTGWNGEWVGLANSLIPSLLGFSLGTYSILFSVMTGRVRKAMREVKNSKGNSYLDEVNATFFHFIFVQILSLISAFIYSGGAAKAAVSHFAKLVDDPEVYEALRWVGNLVGFSLLIYALVLSIGAALSIYTIASIKDPGEGD